jgi:hypothetical protein
MATRGELEFWTLAEPLLERPGVIRSTMMGLSCLRVGGAFFASCDRRTGHLLVKLPEERVEALVAGGKAEPFAPAGRRFRQWAAIPHSQAADWPALLDDALAFVGACGYGSPSKVGMARASPCHTTAGAENDGSVR